MAGCVNSELNLLASCESLGPTFRRKIRKISIIRASRPIIDFQEKRLSSIQSQVQALDPIGLRARPASQIVKLVTEPGLERPIGRAGQEFAKATALREIANR